MQTGVASFTDAWIETQRRMVHCQMKIVASFTDAWIETEAVLSGRILHMVASFTDAWIETVNTSTGVLGFRRIFYRCVD